METTPAIQDYLGAIYDLAGSDKPVIGARLARHMHISAPSITEALRRMQREGYVTVASKKEIRLTAKGLDIARTMARRHRLIERWLTDVLGLDWSRAHDEAHRLEHALSPVVEERLATILGMPSTCPHGNPIPGMPEPEAHNPIPLSQAPAGSTFVVERITEEAEADRQLLRFLWERLHGLREERALLRRALGGAGAHPHRLLSRQDLGHDHSLRHRPLAARSARPHANRLPGDLHRGRPAREPPGLRGDRAGERGRGGPLPPAFRSRGRRLPLLEVRAAPRSSRA